MTAIFQEANAIADAILSEVGSDIVLGLPLGLGKANHIANALYARAAADSSIRLTIFTALTLEIPKASNELERRFLAPVIARAFAGYPELAYARALRERTLPKNIAVNEFFFLAGRWLSVPVAQQSYISGNYTHVVRYLIERGVNVVAQLVAAKKTFGGQARYSLSCNTDLTLDLLSAQAAGKAKFKLVGEVNSELPFMPGAGDLESSAFSHILDSAKTDFPLFAPPNEPVSLTDYAVGLHCARLVPDGGTLQIGIGKEGNAIAHALVLRHRQNAAFREACGRLGIVAQDLPLEEAPFTVGLYGLSEMFVDGFLTLRDAGVLKREVNGAVLEAAFFLGPRSFYTKLREMDDAERMRFRMTAVSFTNELYGDEAAKRSGRVKARFINNAMMTTLLGAVVSDGLKDGQVVSGVGGQYNFASQAFALDDARSIILIKATRTARGKTTSNIRWSYEHETIPRHLRDIIVTEYGVADLRGKSDRDVIVAMLGVADSRFQQSLLREAKNAGKVEADFELPATVRQNNPQRITTALAPVRERGLLPWFPLGTDFTETEQRLLPALESLQAASVSARALAIFLLRNHAWSAAGADEDVCLDRLGLANPATASEFFYRLMVKAALTHTARATH